MSKPWESPGFSRGGAVNIVQLRVSQSAIDEARATTGQRGVFCDGR